MTADGSILSPFSDLKTALENPRLQSGHSIILLNGHHALMENVSTTLTSGAIKAQSPLQATIDLTGAQVADGYGDNVTAQNAITLAGGATSIEDLYITSHPLTRITPTRDSYPLGMGLLHLTSASPADGSKRASLKRCVIGNIIDVSSFVANAGGVVAEDTIIYDTGWDATETADGEHIYTQNNSTSPLKIFRRCLLGRSFGLAVQLYSSGLQVNWHYLFEDLTIMGTIYAAAGRARNDVMFRRILGWKSWISLGNPDPENTALSIIDCYNAGQFISIGISNGTVVTGNTVVKFNDVGTMRIGLAQGDIVVDGNHYYGNATLFYNDQQLTWAQWQSLGFDLNGSYSADLPTTNAVFVVPSDGAGYVLGQVTVYNWESLETLTIDLDALGVTDGQSVVLRSIDDPMVDIRTAIVSGTSITVDMTTRTVSVPHGAAQSLTPALDLRFGAWRVELPT